MRKMFLAFVLGLTVVFMAQFVLAEQVYIRPNGNGFYSAWTNVGCLSSSEWNCVDEVNVNTSDYVYTSSNTSKETFAFGDTGLSDIRINSVTLYYYTKRFSTTKYIMRPLIRIGGSDYFGNQINLSSVYTLKSQTFTTNPATGAAWTLSEVESLEAGMNTFPTNGGAYVAQVYARVDYTYNTDLIISALSFSDSSALDGENVTVYVTTKNNGLNSVGATTTRVSNGGNHDFGVGSLASGEEQNDSFIYTCGVGNVSFTAIADFDNNVTENNETNNQKMNTLMCLERTVDLRSSLFFSKNTAYNGEVVSVIVQTSNSGTVSSGNSTTRVSDDLGNHDFEIAELSPNQGVNNSYDYTCGTVSVSFTSTADIFENVSESNETNNQGTKTLVCYEKTDLIIESINFVEYVGPNSTTYVNVTTAVKNNGTTPAISTHTQLSGTVSENRATSSLQPGAIANLFKSYACTTAHDFIATADIFGVLPETDETNNALSTNIDCVV